MAKPLIKVNIDPAVRERRLQELLAGTSPVQSLPRGPFSIERLDDRYVLHSLPKPFTDDLYTLELSRELLDFTTAHALSDFVGKRVLRSASGQVWDLLSCPDYFTIMCSLEENKLTIGIEEMVAEVSGLLLSDFKLAAWMTTSSVVRYNGTTTRGASSDIVVHEYGTPSAAARETTIIGPRGYAGPGRRQESELYALTGIRDINRIVRAVKFIGDVETYLERLEERPINEIERPVMLGIEADPHRFKLRVANIHESGYARGVVVRDDSV